MTDAIVKTHPSIATKQGRALVIEARNRMKGRQQLVRAVWDSLKGTDEWWPFSAHTAMILILQITDGPSDREAASKRGRGVLHPYDEGIPWVELQALADYLKVDPSFIVASGDAVQHDVVLSAPTIEDASPIVVASSEPALIHPTVELARPKEKSGPRFLLARMIFRR